MCPEPRPLLPSFHAHLDTLQRNSCSPLNGSPCFLRISLGNKKAVMDGEADSIELVLQRHHCPKHGLACQVLKTCPSDPALFDRKRCPRLTRDQLDGWKLQGRSSSSRLAGGAAAMASRVVWMQATRGEFGRIISLSSTQGQLPAKASAAYRIRMQRHAIIHKCSRGRHVPKV